MTAPQPTATAGHDQAPMAPAPDAGWYDLHCSLAKRREQPVPTYDEWVTAGRPR